MNRLMFGLLKPNMILGCDIAGKVVAVGRNVKQFQPGDEVFGDISKESWGGFLLSDQGVSIPLGSQGLLEFGLQVNQDLAPILLLVLHF